MSHHPWTLVLLILATTCVVTDAPAQQARPCSAPGHRQFDFWIGDWEVLDGDGKRVGTNRIESILGGCALRETWTGTGLRGTSLNLYAPDGKWHQTWVDDQGQLLELSGGLENGSMVMRGATPSRQEPGRTVLNRITWTPMDGGRVRQLWEASRDGGESWHVLFDGVYVPQT